MAEISEVCPLCEATDVRLLFNGGRASMHRDFLLCTVCDLVFVPRSQQIDESAQKERYCQHNNRVDDPDYRAFLGRLYYALKPHLQEGAKGLDFGAGPGPALFAMMCEDGFDARMYDLFFHPDEAALTQTYDFITCTETVEHFADPLREFATLDRLMRPGGWLGVMTGMLQTWDDFASWHYHRDPTHINFFSLITMKWLAERHGWEWQSPRQNVVLFRKGWAEVN